MNNLPRDTVPCKPPEDTGPISEHDTNKALAAIAIRDALELDTEAHRALELAEFKAHQAMGIAADEEAKRTPTRMERMELKIDELKKIIDALAETVRKLANGLFDDHQAVVDFGLWRKRHERENHCENCEFRAPEAKQV